MKEKEKNDVHSKDSQDMDEMHGQEQEDIEERDGNEVEESEEEVEEETQDVGDVDYSAQLAEIDEKLATVQQKEIEKMRSDVLEIANVDDRYLKYITGESPEEVEQEINELNERFGGLVERVTYADPSAFNGAKSKMSISVEEQAKEMGRRAYERIKHRLRGIW